MKRVCPCRAVHTGIHVHARVRVCVFVDQVSRLVCGCGGVGDGVLGADKVVILPLEATFTL